MPVDSGRSVMNGAGASALCPWVGRLLVALLAALLAGGCAVQPERPYMKSAEALASCTSAANVDPKQVTPEIWEDRTDPLNPKRYTLHFVEFDDQGWAFPDGADPQAAGGTPSLQIDCAIADLRQRLMSDRQSKVLTIVYVHGWKHSAADDDSDLERFRELLKSRALIFGNKRHIVGLYVGWRGNTLDLPIVNNLSFWGRKNAASRVAEGRVRELFSRIRGLRAYWNGPASPTENACDFEPSGNDRCRLRTIMIGHSFGGLILYNSAAPHLLEMLAIDRDLPPERARPPAARARGLADLIVLLNPAFEGSRYEAVFQASADYQPAAGEQPVLLMLTSTADRATKNAFPIARLVNTMFQYPASSQQQSVAMRRTPGHIERYLTHRLCAGEQGCDGSGATDTAGVSWGSSRRYCGGLVLRAYDSDERPYRPIIWNVRTDGAVIPGHNEVAGELVFRFVEQVYGDVTGLPSAACDDVVFGAARAARQAVQASMGAGREAVGR